MPLVVVLRVVFFVAFFKPVLRLVVFRMASDLFGVVRLICGYVRRPLHGGSASSNVMSGGTSPFTTALAAESAKFIVFDVRV